MVSMDLGGALKALKAERAKVHQELAKLDQAIAVLGGLSGSSAASPNGHSGKRILSAAARSKISKAQKLRWAKVRQQKAAKN